MSGIRAVVANVVLLFVSLIIALFALEAATRVYFGVPIFAPTNFVADMLDLVRRNTGVVVYDEILGWRLADNFGSGRDFSTGALGIRLNSATNEKPAEGAILAVGDSFTAGSGVANDETWPAKLERMVKQPVLNAASGAWGVDQMVLRAELLVPSIKPKALIVGILADDSLRNSFEIYGGGYKPYFAIESDKLILKGVPAPRVTGANVGLDAFRRIFGHSFFLFQFMRAAGAEAWWIANTYRYRQVHSNEMGVKISCLLMDRLQALQKAHGIRVIVLMQYGGAASMQDQPPWYGPPVLACASERGLETVDTFPVLNGLSKTDREKFKALWLDEGGQLGHMSAPGNALIADLLSRKFQ